MLGADSSVRTGEKPHRWQVLLWLVVGRMGGRQAPNKAPVYETSRRRIRRHP